MTSRITVIGGGVSGLVAAYRLSGSHRVTLLEAGDRLGGCLQTTTLGGLLPEGVDAGAEASLYRRRETADLAEELGLALEFPSTAHSSRVFSAGKLQPIPKRTIMGVPGDPEDLLELLGPVAVARIAEDRPGPPISGGDVSLGEFLADRLGDDLVDTLVDPMLGGVYAGRCRDLSLASTVPALLPAARNGTSVLELVRRLLAARDAQSAAESRPVFMSLGGGINRLIPALESAIRARGGDIILGVPVTALRRSGAAWIASTPGRDIESDAVVVATQARATGDLIAEVAPRAAASLRMIPYASTALVVAAIEVSGSALEGSGFLIPPDAGTFIKAATHVSNKWPWVRDRLRPGTALIRMSIGRHGDPPGTWQDLDDAELVRRAFADWSELAGRRDRLLTAEVHHWNRALPQYLTGHGESVAGIDAEIAGVPGLELVGSAYDGIGIPACIARANAAARRLLAAGDRPARNHH